MLNNEDDEHLTYQLNINWSRRSIRNERMKLTIVADPPMWYNHIWFISLSLSFKSKFFFYIIFVACTYACVRAFIQYGARTVNYSFTSSSHLASSHAEYDTAFVFSVLSWKWEYMYVTECKSEKNNNKRIYVHANSLINIMCNELTRSFLCTCSVFNMCNRV